jgi:hypothetical protein
VRSNARTRSGLSRREVKQRSKERRKEEKALQRLQRQPDDLPTIDNPFTPGWAVMDDETDLRALFPPLELPTEVAPAPAVAPEPVAVDDAAPDPTPPPKTLVSLADLAPARVADDDRTARDGDGDDLDQTDEADRDETDGDEAEGPEPLVTPSRGLPLPTLRRRHDGLTTAEASAESAAMMSWLDEVFSQGARDD